MKKYLIILTIILTVTIFSCEQNKKSPEYVAREYLTALKNKDWEVAKKHSTPEQAQNLVFADSLDIDFGILEIKDIKCKVKEDKAECTYCCSTDSGFGNYLKLRKEKGEWKVLPNKESPPPNEQDSISNGWK
jgi:hypothetical protein